MTDLADVAGVDIELGAMVWSKAVRGPDREVAHGGMVVDVGMNVDGAPYVIVLDEYDGLFVQCKARGAKDYQPRRSAVARRMTVADLDETLTTARVGAKMVKVARGALLTVGAGTGFLSTEEFELLIYAGTLLEQSRR